MSKHTHEMDEEMLELAQCHGGYIFCKKCGDIMRHYSSVRLAPRSSPCPHSPWIPGVDR